MANSKTKDKLKLNTHRPKIPEMEELVLDYWDETNAFQKSIDLRPENKPYVFYDGPPFATGLPHYGHILSSTAKDVVPRYWTMKGYRVERTWGWDCHGVPIENMIEKELGLKGGKKGIENLGIDKFNHACRAAILRFDKEWEKIIRRIGRWVDFKNSYKTMDNTYMESVWWAFKTLYDKGLVYEGRKVILYCPRCSTPLSNFEIAMDNSYEEVEDNSIYVAFKIKSEKDTYFLAWTTTPWTLIQNVALVLHPEAEYVKVKQGDKYYWLAKSRLEILKGDYQIIATKKGQELANLEYEPLYTFIKQTNKAHYTLTADFVSLDEGTGIVHTASVYGEDDYQLALKHNLPTYDILDDQGKFVTAVKPLAGTFYKDGESWVIQDLDRRGLLYKAEKITHSYPFCYRCGTPLYYNAIPAWFINIQKIKPDLIKQNEKINWYPQFLKHGRFLKGLQSAPDWNISRSRYWGTPMPIWVGEKTGKKRIIGSLSELRKWAVDPQQVENLTDLHREHLDQIEVWVDDERTEKGRRIFEVFDCWVESGSMPYASIHYPFENKQKFEKAYPAQFISEYIAQTRAWFYTLHVLSVALFGQPAFTNVVTTGTILAEDGSKMSKSKKNYPDPMALINRYGVDAIRYYLMSSVVMKADNLNFSEKQVDEIYKKVILLFFNNLAFYNLYLSGQYSTQPKPQHVLDRWILSRLHHTIKKMTQALDHYDLPRASRYLKTLINDTSTWYLRLSRDRFRQGKSGEILGYLLQETAKLAAPLIPFIAEYVYQNVAPQLESVHHEDWPQVRENYLQPDLEKEMELAQTIVEKGHAARKQAGIRVRQPLLKIKISGISSLSKEIEAVILSELNIKQLVLASTSKELTITLDTHLTPALLAEGKARDIVRDIQQARKKLNLQPHQPVRVFLSDWPKQFTDYIKQKTNALEINKGDKLVVELAS